jgi:NHLM bacteriocin system ABC transporter ATP-binding protein
MPTSLSAKFEDQGVFQYPAPNALFSVEDPNTVWLIDAGKLDVFMVAMKDGKPVGARHHLLRVEEGQALFGVGHHFEDMTLVASAVPGTSLLHLPVSRFRETARQVNEGLALLEQWIASLTQAVATGESPGGRIAHLEANQTVTIPEPTRVVFPEQGLVWASHLKGASFFLRNFSLPLTGPGFFPVTKYGWLQSAPNSEIYSVDSSTFCQVDSEWQGLERFHATAMVCLGLKRQSDAEKEKDLMQARKAADAALFQSSLMRLTAPIQETKTLADAPENCRHPVFLACQTVGNYLGLTIKPHPDMIRGVRLADPIGAVAKASGVRVRKVALKGTWWKEDIGPLLAFREEDKKPLALLPRSARSYELFDPAENLTIPVNSESAALLVPFAFMLYRPFPARKLGVFDLLKFGMRGCQNEVLMLVAVGIATGLMGLITPVAAGIIFDRLIPGAERSQLIQMSVFLLICAVATSLFMLVRSFAVLRLEGKVDASLQAAVWDRLLSLPVSFFRNYSSGDLAERSLGITTIRQVLTGTALAALLGGIFSTTSFFLLFYYSTTLAVLACVLVGIAFVVTLVCGGLQVRFQREISRLSGSISSMLLQFITGIAKFRVSGTEGRVFAVWAREFAKKKELAVRARKISNILAVFTSVFPIFSLGAIFYFHQTFLSQPQSGQLSTGDFIAFLIAFTQFLTTMLILGSAIVAAANIVPLYERALPIFQALPETTQAQSSPGQLAGAIEVSRVTFGYKADVPPVLRDLSITILPGQFVAFVGPSGSGKSTLLRLLLRFETPQSGAIYYDGQDLAGLDAEEVRRQIGVVLQSSRPISGSIFENIVGSSQLTIEDAWEAARLAGIEEDIKAMPMGLHTYLSDGGGGISGGQRQRLMIARAIVNRPRILIFDEATSALDNRTQGIVSNSLQSLQATRVVIAHRLTTIMKADRIFVLNKGQIVQSGTYEELMEQDGLFRKSAKRQMI